jgi:hypothetical protein
MKDLGKTQISEHVRVSSACIEMQGTYDTYYQYETWVFVYPPRPRVGKSSSDHRTI